MLENAGRKRLRRDAASERGIVVNIEFEKMEEFVRDKVNGAVYFALNAEEKLERPACFVAGWEGDVLELTAGVGYVFACFARIGN